MVIKIITVIRQEFDIKIIGYYVNLTKGLLV